jgi:hypothetical protein
MAKPIEDLTATSAGSAGKGYRPPGPCAPQPDYPDWLKGVVYLHLEGSTIIEKGGLVNKPCGL